MARRILAGGVPEPEELFGREHTIRFIWEQLRGNNILLVAPRRFGKTGVMNHLLKRTEPGYVAVYLDVEDVHDPEVFCSNLIAGLLEHNGLRSIIAGTKALPKKVLDIIASRVGGVKMEGFEIELRDVVRDEWASVTRALILEMEKADQTVLFILDEFPQLIENIARKHQDEAARTFLQWFRSLRMKQKDVLRRYRFVLGGSTSIDLTLRRLEVPDKLNDFYRVPIEALSQEHAEALFDALAETSGLRFTAEGRAAFFELVAPPVPYFLQLFVSQIRLEEKLKDRELGPEEVAAVYHRRVLGPTCRAYFDYYRQRLKRYGEKGERAAWAVLQEVAHAPSGRVSDSMLYDVYRRARGKGASSFEFSEIMADLESDWYLLLDLKTNEYGFLLQVMRDWWKRFSRTVGGKSK
ncbi:MAG: hypothetical protein LAP87_05320 [Acidobacteriia bacterium]|nr:hypothetical protein [Terriglobia bacterium]